MTKNQSIDVPVVLRAIRAKLNLTQEQLADRLGVSFATVNRWEGRTKPQKAARDVIVALAHEAGVDLADTESVAAESAAGLVRRRRGGSAVPTTKPMEQMLWDAACSIRGEKDAAKFKDYLLPLLFLKRLSDVFDDEIGRLAEDYGDRETALEIAESDPKLLRFYLPPEARWGIISGRDNYEWPVDEKGQSTRPKDIGEHLTKAVRAVVKQNPVLSGVLDVVDFAAERNGERDINPAKLRGVVETFSDPRYRLGLADVEPDFLGRAYEYLLRKFAEGSGQSAGEFFTPTEVGFLMAHILRPRPGEECHDYACGSAGLLVKLQLVSKELDPLSKVPLKLTGQELQAESYAVANMNGIIHDMDIEIARGDTMINPKFRNADGKIKTFDIVVANPMWNQPFNPDIFANDPFDRFRTAGGVTTGKGDWAWLQHTLACLSDNGRAAIILDTGAITRGSGSKNDDKERAIRKWFVDRDLIDGVILLPDNLFYNTTAAGIIIVLNKRKPASRKDKIVLFNASKHLKKGKPKNYIPEEDIRPLSAAYLKGEPVEGEIAVITRQQTEEADYNLSPSRWVGQSGDDAHRPIKEIMAELTNLDVLIHKADAALGVYSKNKCHSDNNTETPLPHAAWETDSIGNLFDIGAGKTMSAAARNGAQKTPFLRTSNVFWDEIDLTEVDEMAMSDQEIAEKNLLPGDLLVCEGGEIGRAAVWKGEASPMSFQNHLHRLRVKRRDIEPRFYAYYLQAAFTQLGIYEGVGNKTTIPNLSRNRLAALDVPVPPPSEQQCIVAALAIVRTAIDLHKRKKAVLEELFRSLLYKLMTGEIRVTDLDLSALENSKEAI